MSTTTQESAPTVTVNGTTYPVSDLSPAARTQLLHIQAVDVEINRLKVQLGIAQTARQAYLRLLDASLPKTASASSDTAA